MFIKSVEEIKLNAKQHNLKKIKNNLHING